MAKSKPVVGKVEKVQPTYQDHLNSGGQIFKHSKPPAEHLRFIRCPKCRTKTKLTRKQWETIVSISHCKVCGFVREPDKYAHGRHTGTKPQAGFVVRKEKISKENKGVK